jgi:protein involved in polysaccharide export with SLBB domain
MCKRENRDIWRNARCVAAVGVALTLGACASLHQAQGKAPVDDLSQVIDTSDSTPIQKIHAQEFDLLAANEPIEVKLEFEDQIRFVVLGYPELTLIARVQRDGNVVLPIVGDVPAANRSLDDVRQEVTTLLVKASNTDRMRVESDDVLKFAVWRHPDLTHLAPVQTDGRISLPLVGEIDAEGKTLDEIRAETKLRLSQYIRDPEVFILLDHVRRSAISNPQVSILPEKLHDRRVAVAGEILIPGIYPLTGKVRALDILAQSQYKGEAALNSVLVIRNWAGKPQYRVLHLRDFLAGSAPQENVYLAADDIIFVPKTTIAKVDDFIDRFFVRTRGIFDWYSALQTARYARAAGELNQLLLKTLNTAAH